MIHYSLSDIQSMDKIFRLNLINSCTGFKSANLLASRSKDGISNVAVFSSITHLGSNPPLLGFVLRPTTVPRNSFDNIKNTQFFTVNHIHKEIIADAHHTSAKYPGEISEFDKTNLFEEYKDDFYAPYVQGARIQMGCKYVNDYFLKENGCLLVVAEIEHVYVKEAAQLPDGFLSLEIAETVTVNGLDGYALPKLIERFEYARPKK
ncbi:MAG: flavin reductase [Flavobacteriaceae bacterium]|nr:flavin reductase [Flavobacteriaceae bacterium]